LTFNMQKAYAARSLYRRGGRHTKTMRKDNTNGSVGNQNSDIMTLREVAAYLRCHESTLYRMMRGKALPHFRIGSDFRFRRADIMAWIESRHQEVER
jgi:excisionase family DNA binding protein